MKLSKEPKRSKLAIDSNPMKLTKQRNTASINAIIWLSVSEEAKMPIDTNAEASKTRPMYEPHIPPVSILPNGLPN